MSQPVQHQTRIWRTPLLIAVSTLVGLTSAACGEGAGRWVSWIALATPLVVAAWRLGPGKRARSV
ncbi:hypothetical protein AWB80_07332 [Caballeronia pedi]|uniref:Uncharacterized protein n=1 Tax=Caballeronia pedi TaxID=1777141 RepID=A0A158DRM9_9BURK|nr:hypothetical protein [Caballeronia pedi]SAK97272.1 hypothetical protein AWB80_07332 [Caballeronia pedi]